MPLSANGRCQQLQGSAGPYPFNVGKHLIVAVEMQAYGDESGGRDTRYCFVAGYMAAPSAWEPFKSSWREVLGHYDVPFFHAVDFFQESSWRSSKSPYHGWDMPRARAFLDELLALIDLYDIRPVGGGLDVTDFLALPEEDRRKVTGAIRQATIDGRSVRWRTTGKASAPYFVAIGLFIEEALSRSDGTLHFMFDDHQNNKGRALKLFDEIKKFDLLRSYGGHRIGQAAYDRSERHPPLQAADLYAYWLNSWFTRGGHGHVPELIGHARPTLTRKRDSVGLMDAGTFHRLVDATQDEWIVRLRTR